MRKAWIVAKHEFFTTVKRWGFLIATFGLPVLLTAIMGFALKAQTQSIETAVHQITSAPIGWVDEAGVITIPPPPPVHGGREWKRYASPEEAREHMSADGITIVVVLPKDYIAKGAVDVYTTIRPSIFNLATEFVNYDFQNWLVKNLLKDADPALVNRARDPARERPAYFLSATGTAATTERPDDYKKRMASGIGFFFLLFVSISVAGGYLIQGLADEKENRVLEMVVSSVTPLQLMAGKLIGLGAVGLLQVLVWSILGVSTVVYLGVLLVLNPALFLVCFVFYLLGYTLFGCLLLGIGSLGTNQREATQYTWMLTMVSISPIFAWLPIVAEPQGTLAHVFSWIPLTTPVTMMLRFGVDPKGTPVWEVLAAVGLLVVSTALALRLSAKLYRVGLLLYGKRPTLREVWRWLWE